MALMPNLLAALATYCPSYPLAIAFFVSRRLGLEVSFYYFQRAAGIHD